MATITEMGYQRIAQECLNAYGDIYAEFGGSRQTLIDSAEVLYREHGPFELDFPNYAMDTPDWYDYNG
jgi:hypothetical protein